MNITFQRQDLLHHLFHTFASHHIQIERKLQNKCLFRSKETSRKDTTNEKSHFAVNLPHASYKKATEITDNKDNAQRNVC